VHWTNRLVKLILGVNDVNLFFSRSWRNGQLPKSQTEPFGHFMSGLTLEVSFSPPLTGLPNKLDHVFQAGKTGLIFVGKDRSIP